MESQFSDLTDSCLTINEVPSDEIQIEISSAEGPIHKNYLDDNTTFLTRLNSCCFPEKQEEIEITDNWNLINEFHSFFRDADASLDNLADFCRFTFHPVHVSY